MSFSKMVELLQIKNNGKIVLVNNGNFYVAIGKDAVLLNKLLELKVTCISQEICKVGFPIMTLEKYTSKLVEKRYSYVVYYFDKETEELKILEMYRGENENKILEQNVNCYNCKHYAKYCKTDDKYIKAVAKLLAEENEQFKNLNDKNKKDKKEEKKKWYIINEKKKKTN